MLSQLHERECELDVIVAALDEVVARRGRVVVVEGPAGIGKTSLLEAGCEAARARGVAVARARGSDLEVAYAWGVVRQLFEPRLRGMSAGSRGRVLAGAAALAGPVVLPGESAPSAEVDASFGVLHGLYWLLVALAEQRPQLLVVDDLHWADEASIRFLEFLANRLDDLSVLLLAARRPMTGAARLTATVELAPLSVEATAALLAERDGASVSLSFARACHGATGGNPLLLRRLADGLPGETDAEAVGRHGPYAVAGAVGATLARLGAGAARLAAAVAVLEQAPLVTAARLADVAADEVSACAEQLVRAGILRDERPLEFEHVLVRDAVLSAMTAGERARMHADAARILGDAGAAEEAIAVHLLRAEARGDAAVAGILSEAGRRALASGALTEAAALLARAVAEPPPPAMRSALLLDLARAEHGLGRPEAIDRVLAASDAAQDDVERAEAALGLMWASGPAGLDPREMLAMIELAIAGVAGRHRELELKLESSRLMVAFLAVELFQESLGQAERFAGLAGRTAGECELLLHVATHRFLRGRSADEVAEPVERAVADAQLVAAIGPESAWFLLAIGQLFKTDRLDVARRTVAIGLAAARRRGSAPGFAAASVWRAWIALRAGAAADAEADARAAHQAPSATTWQELFCVCCLIDVLVERGGLDEAQAVLAAAGEDAVASDVGAELLLSTRSNLRAARGDPRGALTDQLEARRRRGAEGLVPDPDFDGWLRIARLLHVTGDERTAAREADEALSWARIWGTPGYIGQALTASGLILGGDDGLALLRDAVEHLEQSPARRELAQSLVELGASLRRRGERKAAREPLRRALDLATAGGMTATAERAREELRVTGAKLRRPDSSGLGSLTPSERRIAELAADGASNPEIAQALFVTVKTVEMHLSNAYRKLGIKSRRQLTTLLAPDKEQGANTGSTP